MKYIQYRMTTNKPEHSDVLAFYDVETKTIIENRDASDTAKIIQLLPDRIRRYASSGLRGIPHGHPRSPFLFLYYSPILTHSQEKKIKEN